MSRHVRRHKTVKVRVGHLEEDIDVKLAPLVRGLWQAGIKTMMSCQETEPGIAWVEFDSVDELVKFLNIVAEHGEGKDTLYNRVTHQSTDSLLPCWEYQLNLMDGGLDPDINGGHEGPSDFFATVGVYFPDKDLPVLIRKLAAWNALV